MNDPFRKLLLFAALFFACAGLLVFWGYGTDAVLGTAPVITTSTAHAAAAARSFAGEGLRLVFGLGVLLLCGLVYLAPAINAYQRNHRERKPILVLSIFLGWTVLGWIAALIWSYTSQVAEVEEAK